MSKVVKIIVGAVLVVGSFFMGGTLWPAVVRLVGGAMLSSATKPKIPPTTQKIEQRLTTSLDPEAFGSIVFGETALDTQVRYWEVWGPEKTRVDYVFAAAIHEIEGFGDLHVEDDLVTFSGNDATGKYAGALTRRTRTVGVSGTYLAAGSGAHWKETDGKGPWMTGIAHYVLAWTWSQEKLPQIPTRITQKGKGAKLYDPRRDSTRGGSGSHRADDQSTWEYAPLDSNGVPIGRNAALQILWYKIGWHVQDPDSGEWKLRAGEGTPLDDIDFDSFIEAANRCEAERYYSDCILSTGNDHNSNLAVLEAACAGTISDAGGQYSLHIWVDDTADIAQHFTAEDIVGEAEWTPKVSLSNHFNQGHGTFVDPDSLYQRRDYPVVRDLAYEAEDGRKRRKPFHYEAVQDPEQAQKLTRLELNRSRKQGVYQAPFNWKANNVRLFSVVTLTIPRRGWVNKIFRVINIDADPMGPIWLALREDGPEVYEGGTVLPLDPPGEGTGYDPRDISAPAAEDWDVFGTSITSGSGAQTVGFPAIKVTGASPAPNLVDLIVEVGETSAGPWVAHATLSAFPSAETLITAVPPGVQPFVSLRYRNSFGVRSERTVIGPVTVPPLFTANRALEANTAAPGSDLDIELTNASIRIDRLEGPGGNLVFDPLFILGPNEWTVDGASAPLLDQELSPRALLVEYTASGAGAARVLRLTGRRPAAEGERFEIAAEADFDGVTSAATIGIAFYNAAGAAISTETAALADSWTRAGGYVEAPAGTATAALVVNISASGAGEGVFRIRRPKWRKAAAAEVNLTAFVDESAATVTRLKETRIAAAKAAAYDLVLTAANADALAQVRQIIISQVEGGSALATQLNELAARVGGNEANIVTLNEAIATGSEAQAAILEALRISVGQLNGFEDPLFILGAADWTGSPNPPWLDQEDETRALLIEGSAGATGEIARMTFGPRFALAGGERLELAADVKLSGVASAAVIRAVFEDATGAQISDVSVATGGTTSWGRVGSFVTAPANARAVAFAVAATAVATGDYTVLARKPHFGGALEGQSVLTPFAATLSPRVAEAKRRLIANAREAAEGLRLAVSDANRKAEVDTERSARLTGDSAEAYQRSLLDARMTTAEGDIAARATITALNQAVADAESARATLETELTAAFQAADSGLQSDIDTRATITALNTVASDAAAARAALETALRAEWQGDDADLQTQINSRATITALQQVEADAASARATLQSALEAEIDGNAAAITVNAGAIADLETASAFWELLVAAGGGDPAIFRLTAGEGGSEITLASSILGFWNTEGGGSLVKAMEIQSGIVRILKELRLKQGAALTSYYDEGGAGQIKVLDIGQDANGPYIVLRNRLTGEEIMRVDQTVGAIIGGGALRVKQLSSSAGSNVTVNSETFVDLCSVSLPADWDGANQGICLRDGGIAFQTPGAGSCSSGDVNNLTGNWRMVIRKSGEADAVLATSTGLASAGTNPGIRMSGSGTSATAGDSTFGTTNEIVRGLRLPGKKSGPGCSLVLQSALQTTGENAIQPPGGQINILGGASSTFFKVDLI